MKYILFLLFLAGSSTLCAQINLTIVLRQLPQDKQSDRVYVAGSFNNWSPGNNAQSTNSRVLKFSLAPGLYEYKFTRGSWETVEVDQKGNNIKNRSLGLTRDTQIVIDIEQWSDHFPKKKKMSTAGKNVHIIDTSFFIPQLNRYRRIWVYLPESYNTGRQSYPVLYMQDGQNVFDEATSFSGEWGADEAADSLAPHFGEMIIVGVDNGGEKRLNEYAPYDMEKYGKGEGNAYVDFLANTLQPFINRHYRTKRRAAHNWVAGSSMGGLISFYTIYKYPNKFGAAGVFSPSFWINPQFKSMNPRQLKKIKGRIYFFAGQKESPNMVTDMLQVFEQVRQHSKAVLKTVIKSDADHSEASWREEFPEFYKWLFAKE